VLEDEQLDRVVAVGTDEDGFPLLLSQSSHTFTLLRERSRGAFEAVASVDLAQSQNTSAVVGRHVVIATMEDLGIIDSATGEVTRVPGAMLDRVVLTAPVMLDDHRALLTGGFETPEWFAWIEATMRDVASGSPPGAGNTAETLASKRTFLVDAASGTIEESMELTGSGRVNHVVAPLGDGRVLVVGGVPSISGGPTPLPAMAPILHDPSAGTSIALTDAPRVGFFPTATPLLDGSVLFTGTNPVENDPGEAKGLAIRFIPVTP
jgi:hypothetical protein